MNPILFVSISASLLAGCCTLHNSSAAAHQSNPNWRTEFTQTLPLLGHHNWILVVDKAYPLQSSTGTRTIYTGQSLLKTLEEVSTALKSSTHAKPIYYTDKELSFITEEQSKGISAYRDELKEILKGAKVHPLLHSEVFPKIDAAAKLFNVLILKTDETIPYSSVFIELDCAYWNSEKEDALRQSMK